MKRKLITCVEAFSCSVDSRLLKLCYLGVEWGHNGMGEGSDFFTKDYKEKIPKNLFFSGKSFSLNSLILCESTGSADYRLFKTLFSGEKWVQWGRRVKKIQKNLLTNIAATKGD